MFLRIVSVSAAILLAGCSSTPEVAMLPVPPKEQACRILGSESKKSVWATQQAFLLKVDQTPAKAIPVDSEGAWIITAGKHTLWFGSLDYPHYGEIFWTLELQPGATYRIKAETQKKRIAFSIEDVATGKPIVEPDSVPAEQARSSIYVPIYLPR